MIDIHIDNSGVTLEYILTLEGRQILQGDGWASPHEIMDFLDSIVAAVKEE